MFKLNNIETQTTLIYNQKHQLINIHADNIKQNTSIEYKLPAVNWNALNSFVKLIYDLGKQMLFDNDLSVLINETNVGKFVDNNCHF